MTWQGRISGSNKVWGDVDAPQMITVDGLSDAPDRLPGKLVPDAPQVSGTGLHLPGLDALTGRDRLILIGFQSLNPHWDGLAVVVQAHATLWVTLSAGEVIHLQGSAVPDLAARLGVADASPAGLAEALDRPERLPLLLHSARSADEKLGALLGADIGAARTLWLGQQAVLVGDGRLAQGYGQALAAAHVPVTVTDTTAMIRKGFEKLAEAFPQPL